MSSRIHSPAMLATNSLQHTIGAQLQNKCFAHAYFFQTNVASQGHRNHGLTLYSENSKLRAEQKITITFAGTRGVEVPAIHALEMLIIRLAMFSNSYVHVARGFNHRLW